ncbi:MAG TPA: orotate phosphoribosyltransferase [Thermoanaerobaculia bacterium]|jgi:orotate phosphoribosyltransferase|nr:orotate phosphoribosyltransferase [Thermoanaerobaculia bacterium]
MKQKPVEDLATVAAAPDAGTETLAMLQSAGALLEGHFLLSSGLHSPGFVQCALLLEKPVRARRVGERLAALLAPLEVESVLSPALGGLIIGHEVAAALGVPFRFTERKDGKMELRRGFAFGYGERVVVVEDAITTGKSTLEAAAVASANGAAIVGVGAIVDRTGGKKPFSVPLVSLLALDFPTWPAAKCPLCAAGGKPQKPGSRA